MKLQLVLIFIILMTIFIVPVHADDGTSAPKTLPSEFALLLPTATVRVEGGTLTPDAGGEPIVTEIAVTATPEGGVEVELGDKAFFDVSGLALEYEIDPECEAQLPVTPESGVGTVCGTFDNWITEEIQLDGNNIALASAEVWLNSNTSIILPIVVRNTETNQLGVNGNLTQPWEDWMDFSQEAFLNKMTRLNPGMTLNITLAIPTEGLAGNSTQGFGFEATAYDQADIDRFFASGNATLDFGNILCPVVDIAERW